MTTKKLVLFQDKNRKKSKITSIQALKLHRFYNEILKWMRAHVHVRKKQDF